MTPIDPDEAQRLARQLDGQTSDAERAELVDDLTAGDELLAVFADASAGLSEAASLAEVAPTPDPMAPRPQRLRPHNRRSSRRQRVPPALMRPQGEILEGAAVLDEHRESPRLGLLLWSSMRDVLVWASVPTECRAGLFSPDASEQRMALINAAGVGDDLQVLLVALAGLVARPEDGDDEVLSLVCMEIARWARDRGSTGTAIAFAQAGALVSPANAGPALSVGNLVRLAARDSHALARAGTWLRRAVGLARRRGDWRRYSEALVELGALYAGREMLPEAVHDYTRARRAARRHGLGEITAAARHGLARIAAQTGHLEEAAAHCRGALRNYERGHARIPDVLLDLAGIWIQLGEVARAIPVVQRQLQLRHDPRERAQTLGLLARAMASRGPEHRMAYQTAWSEAWSIINRPGAADENHARALLQLVHAAHAAKDWIRLDQAVGLQAREARHADRRVSAQIGELLTFEGSE